MSSENNHVFTPQQSLQLEQLMRSYGTQDCTETIRELKHSERIKADIATLLRIRHKYKDDEDKIFEEGIAECMFLYTNYTNIFNKLRKGELELPILLQFLQVLKAIEDGKLTQQEGSFRIGELLKSMFVDAAIRKADAKEREENPPVMASHDIDWQQFKARFES